MQTEITTALVFLMIGMVAGGGLSYWFLHRVGVATGNVQTAVNSAVQGALVDVHNKLNQIIASVGTKAAGQPPPPVPPPG